MEKVSCKEGSIELILGCMFAGKSSRLHERFRSHILQGKAAVCFIPTIDTRYTQRSLSMSHDGSAVQAIRISTLEQDPAECEGAQFIFVDEGQFLPGLADFCLRQKKQGKHVCVAALSSDSRGNAWPEVAKLVPVHVSRYTALTSVCIVCQGEAFYSRCLSSSSHGDVVNVGGDDKYVATCLTHFDDSVPITAEMIQQRKDVLSKLRISV